MALAFDRTKYLNLFKTQGASAALGTLHKDITRWEFEAFEGKKGYDPQMWREIEEVRKFSRELWKLALG